MSTWDAIRKAVDDILEKATSEIDANRMVMQELCRKIDRLKARIALLEKKVGK